MIPQANQIYRHFKGNLYRIITVAEHTESSEQLVIYQALYGDYKVYARPLVMFMSEVDKGKYPDVIQKNRFELVEQMVQPMVTSATFQSKEKQIAETDPVCTEPAMAEEISSQQTEPVIAEEILSQQTEPAMTEENVSNPSEIEENVTIDPLLEAYLDTDSYREKSNILHGLHHRITEHMLNTMAIVIDFELPEGDIETKYNALNDCLLTKEKYECNRIF